MATPAESGADGPGPMHIRAVLQPRGPAAALVLDDAQLAALGAPSKNPPVRVTVNGHTFAGRVARMRGETLIGFSLAVREATGVSAGDEIEATIALDTGPRKVDVPPELAVALDAKPSARASFDALAYSHRKEFARWVAEAKKPETRERRVEQTLANLADGRTR